MKDARIILLNQWAQTIAKAGNEGALNNGKPLSMLSIETVCGPRAGALEIHAGFDTGALLRVMSSNDFALHRQFVPWQFVGEPSVYLASRFVRLEAGWPESLAEKNIALRSLAPYPKGSAYWIAGKNEAGATIALSLSDTVPHFLFAGHTGSGKTVAIRSAIAQLSANTGNSFVLIDGKYGDGLGCFNRLPGLVAPVATSLSTARAALGWSVSEMRRRYETGIKTPRVVIVVDEIQEFTGANGDAFSTEMVRKLVVQGRGVNMHMMVGTQHPTIDAAFSDPAIRRQLVGKVALRVEDYKASEVAVGGPNPRADHLCGAGDSYVVVPEAVHRVQIAYVPESEIERMGTSTPAMAEFPPPDSDAAGTLEDGSQSRSNDSNEDIALAILAARYEKKRRALGSMYEEYELPRPGNDRLDRLVVRGQEIWNAIQSVQSKLELNLCE